MISENHHIEATHPENGTEDREACSKRWYVAMVRMHHERKVGERLSQMGIENFVPVRETVHQWSDRKKKVVSPLIPMMVFVHADEAQRKEALTLPSVSRYLVLRGESTPAVVPDAQMERFVFMLQTSQQPISMHDIRLTRGQQVRVVRGPLKGLVGELVEVDGQSKIAVCLNVLGCACADMPASYVEPIEETSKTKS